MLIVKRIGDLIRQGRVFGDVPAFYADIRVGPSPLLRGAHRKATVPTVTFVVPIDWLARVYDEGIAVVEGGLMLSASRANESATPEGCEGCWIGCRATLTTTPVVRRNSLMPFDGQQEPGYVVSYGGLLGFGQHPADVFARLVEAWRREIHPPQAVAQHFASTVAFTGLAASSVPGATVGLQMTTRPRRGTP